MTKRSIARSWATDPLPLFDSSGPATMDAGGGKAALPLIGTVPPMGVIAILAGAALGAHGYEVFNNHLTIDEEVFINSDAWPSWVAQGRWGMALLSYLTIERPVGPTLSTFIGTLGLLLALFLVLRGLTRSNTSLVIAGSVGIAAPTVPFLLSFSTLSFGAGVAALAVALAARAAILSGRWSGLLGALALTVVAVGIYDPFVFLLPAVAVLWLTGTATARRISLHTALQCVLRVAVLSALALGISRLIARAAQTVTGVPPSGYAESMLDLSGLLDSPRVRLVAAMREAWLVASGSPTIFGDADLSLLEKVTIGSLVVIIVGVVLKWKQRPSLLPLILVGATVGIPVVAELFTPGRVPLRSQVYMPFLLSGLLAIALETARSWHLRAPRILLSVTGILLALVLMSYTNRLYLSTEIAFNRDSNLAFELDEEMNRVTQGIGEAPHNLVVLGIVSNYGRLPTPAAETLGASFYEWNGGTNTGRVSGLLRYVTGRMLVPADPATALRAAERAQEMPAWPLQGSVTQTGKTIVVKLSDPTPQQIASWCSSGSESALCAGTG